MSIACTCEHWNGYECFRLRYCRFGNPPPADVDDGDNLCECGCHHEYGGKWEEMFEEDKP